MPEDQRRQSMSDRPAISDGGHTGQEYRLNPHNRDEELPQDPLVLASASPRRRELLSLLGLKFQVRPAEIDETPLPQELPPDLVRRLSIAKARAVSTGVDRGFVVGADSLVVSDGQIFGKPGGPDQARGMLQKLRGTQHQVVTGVTVIDASSGRRLTCSMASSITLRNFTDAEIERSIDAGTPLDKAGAYAVQDRELSPAESLDGCYTNIVGLPLCRLVQMLDSLGFRFPAKQPVAVSTGCTGDCPLDSGGVPGVLRGGAP